MKLVKESLYENREFLTFKEALKSLYDTYDDERITLEDLARFVFNNWKAFTDAPRSSEYPDAVYHLIEHFGFDEDEFNDYMIELEDFPGMINEPENELD